MIVTVTRKQLVDVEACEASMDFFDSIAFTSGRGPDFNYVIVDTRDTLLMVWFYSYYHEWAQFAVRHGLLPYFGLRNQVVTKLETQYLRAERAVISESVLVDWNVIDTNFEGAMFDRVDIKDSELSGMHMPGMDIRFSNLRRVMWGYVNLSDGCVYQSNFYKVNMHHARFSDTLFWGCRFDNVDLSSAHGGKVRFRNCAFKDTKLANIDLRTATFEECVFYGEEMDLSLTMVNPATFPYVKGWTVSPEGVMLREPAPPPGTTADV
jgi:hypothetical protein